VDFLPPPSRATSRPPQPLEYRSASPPVQPLDDRSPPRPFEEYEARGLASFAVRALGIVITIPGLLICLLLFTGGIDDRDAVEWVFTVGIIVLSVGVTLWILGVVLGRWERAR
jgi:hypothetical protein